METWKLIEGHPNHYVSDMGNVKSVDHIVNDKGRPSHRKGKIFHLTSGKNGYVRVFIEGRCYTVHRLVGKAFIPNPEGKEMINHINGRKDDNRAENLEWVTRTENSNHAYRTGLHIFTAETREKLAAVQRGRKMPESTKRILAEHRPVNYRHSEETKSKISESIKNWHLKRRNKNE